MTHKLAGISVMIFKLLNLTFMKRKIFMLFAFATLSVFFILSCSGDDLTNIGTTQSITVSKLGSGDLTKATAEFNAILKSTAWIDHQSATNSFIAKLKGLALPKEAFTNRDIFATWITNNRANTLWSKDSDALQDYDNLMLLAETLNSMLAPFIEKWSSVDIDDVRVIFAPTVTIPIDISGGDPCIDGCNAADNAAVNNLNSNYFQEIVNAAQAHDYAAFASIKQYYTCMLAEQETHHQACLAACA